MEALGRAAEEASLESGRKWRMATATASTGSSAAPSVCVGGGAWREKESALERKPGIQCGHKVLSKSSGSSKEEKCASRDCEGGREEDSA